MGATGPFSTGKLGSGVTGRSSAEASVVVQARTKVPRFARDDTAGGDRARAREKMF